MGTFKAIYLDVYDPHLQLEAEDSELRARADKRAPRGEVLATLHVIDRLASCFHTRTTTPGRHDRNARR
ncbi:hypothetical protein [Pseudomonas sp. RIT-PI-AD]|uniref:hypothetical protein n=1 Tax=Pseudomonas sp. RIT-PI-AD TaxID=3035294 RepID=UPI0021D8786C|nr:hypothetical protein [Pseudomonas sp. RIT-PI-AD]